MSGFKLIAIRPHSDCHLSFTKVLEPGRLYQFYGEYKFYNQYGELYKIEDIDIQQYSKEDIVPEDLYNIKNLNINIAAIVGKNGSGKSSLIELLLYNIYVLGTTIEENGEKILQPHYMQLKHDIYINKKRIEVYNEKKKKLENLVSTWNNNSDNEESSKNSYSEKEFTDKLNEISNYEFNINDLLRDKDSLQNSFKFSEQEHNFIIENFKCSLYFELDGIVWELNTAKNSHTKVSNQESELSQENIKIHRNIKVLNLLEPKSPDVLKAFFYTIMLNYSHHSLNSEHIGSWINTLFHKNDGYKTPAVINPMRTDGNFDINIENKLAKSRLLTNLLIEALYNRKNPKKIKLTDKQWLHKIRFRYDNYKQIGKNVTLGDAGSKTENEKYIISGKIDAVNLIQELLPLYFDGYSEVLVQNKNLPYSTNIINYLDGKIRKTLKNYPEYDSSQKYENFVLYFRHVLPILKEDRSHATFKIARAMFYLRKLLIPSSVDLWNIEKEYVDFDLYELLDWMEIESMEDLYLIFERTPPGIFDFEFILDGNETMVTCNEEEIKKLPRLEHLSSGEQQKIHTINSIIYHLNNIFSVHNSNDKVERIKYDYINIIFDEIELYFHPDLQREFINDLLNNIERLEYITLDKKERIKGLNFIFSTHSPFILSDIPSQNILKIEYDIEKQISVQIFENNQTFGANIHDLLANSFFFRGGTFIGEKSNNYIKEQIRKIIVLREEKILVSKEESDLLFRKASIIGEPFFRQKLQDMVIEQTEFNHNEKIEMIIEQKRKEIEDLQKLKNDSSDDIN